LTHFRATLSRFRHTEDNIEVQYKSNMRRRVVRMFRFNWPMFRNILHSFPYQLRSILIASHIPQTRLQFTSASNMSAIPIVLCGRNPPLAQAVRQHLMPEYDGMSFSCHPPCVYLLRELTSRSNPHNLFPSGWHK